MKLYLKQKVFSWRDRFFVKDETGSDRYAVEGELFSWGKKLHIYSADGEESAFIRQKLISLMPRYYVEIGGDVICEIVKEFTFFKPSYRVDGLAWHLKGDIWAHDYVLYSSVGEEMRISKEWFTWGDSYVIDVTNPANELLCLCVALAVDCAIEESRDRD
ncbi:MAG: LURP-one-related family protein [Clostridiales bacterium]|jgi:uncharacterized protein YxjI|nr:LURP-one-related family protein [Clostridiales bacterium]